MERFLLSFGITDLITAYHFSGVAFDIRIKETEHQQRNSVFYFSVLNFTTG